MISTSIVRVQQLHPFLTYSTTVKRYTHQHVYKNLYKNFVRASVNFSPTTGTHTTLKFASGLRRTTALSAASGKLYCSLVTSNDFKIRGE